MEKYRVLCVLHSTVTHRLQGGREEDKFASGANEIFFWLSLCLKFTFMGPFNCMGPFRSRVALIPLGLGGLLLGPFHSRETSPLPRVRRRSAPALVAINRSRVISTNFFKNIRTNLLNSFLIVVRIATWRREHLELFRPSRQRLDFVACLLASMLIWRHRVSFILIIFILLSYFMTHFAAVNQYRYQLADFADQLVTM